jgi:hypothetical protein
MRQWDSILNQRIFIKIWFENLKSLTQFEKMTFKHEEVKVHKHLRKHKTYRRNNKFNPELNKDRSRVKLNKRSSVTKEFNQDMKNQIYMIEETQVDAKKERIPLETNQKSNFMLKNPKSNSSF